MIQITGSGFEGDNVIVNFDYDYQGQDHQDSVSVSISAVAGMSVEYAKQQVINRVNVLRRTLSETAVTTLVNSLKALGDLEAPP